jgi:hypothetical protein
MKSGDNASVRHDRKQLPYLSPLKCTSKIAVFWDVTPCSLADTYLGGSPCLRSEDGAAGSFETLANIYQTTRRHIPEYSTLTNNILCEQFYRVERDPEECDRRLPTYSGGHTASIFRVGEVAKEASKKDSQSRRCGEEGNL